MGKMNILIGDITSDEILKNHDCIVNPTNPAMRMGMGISGAIFKKAGVEKLENFTSRKYHITYESNANEMKVGEIRITPGFDLNMDILFVQGPRFWDYNNPLEILKMTYLNLVDELSIKPYKNILLPSLGTGEYGFSHEEVGPMLKAIITNFVKNHDINIDLVLYEREVKKYYE